MVGGFGFDFLLVHILESVTWLSNVMSQEFLSFFAQESQVLNLGTQDPTSRGFITQAAQSLVGVAGFLAATGAVAFFYYGRLIEFISPSSSFTQPMRVKVRIAIETKAKTDFEASMKTLASSMMLSLPLTEQEIKRSEDRLSRHRCDGQDGL